MDIQQVKIEPGQPTNLKQQQNTTAKAQTVSIEDFLSSDKQQQKIKTEKNKSSLNVNATTNSIKNSNEQNAAKKDSNKSSLIFFLKEKFLS